MLNYDYFNAMKSDVLDYINENINYSDFDDIEELETYLNDELFCEDSVTGNASGSYTFDYCTAKEYVTDNIDVCRDALSEFCVAAETIGEKFLTEDWEYFDVTIRCYLLSEVIAETLKDIEKDFNNAHESD